MKKLEVDCCENLCTHGNIVDIVKGKLQPEELMKEELKELIWETEATGIICDDELSPAQIGSLQDELQTKVMDRTLVILDIFAARASTSEGKIQVELAQLKYRQSRLIGLGFPVQAWRGNRYKRAGRKEAGDGPEADQRKDRPAEPGTERCQTAQGSNQRTANQEWNPCGSSRRLYECR